jgi:O-methyltransferase involved in polyketide biosynthesis
MSKYSTNECMERTRIIDSHVDRNIDGIGTYVILAAGTLQL